MADIEWETEEMKAGLHQLEVQLAEKTKQAVLEVADELLRLSQFEVPHDTGNLQNTGHVEPGEDEYEKIVGYNGPYAAYQHEGVRADGTHLVTQWQDGRKKKYLEDPLRQNLEIFQQYFQNII